MPRLGDHHRRGLLVQRRHHARALPSWGLRAIVYLEVFGSDPEHAQDRFDTLRQLGDGAWSDLVRAGVSPHAPYTVTPEVYALCASLGVPVATHLSESVSELRFLLGEGGPWESFRELFVTPPGTAGTRLLADIGALGPGLVAAHCVMVDAEEIGLLAASGTAVAHCPRSNAMLG